MATYTRFIALGDSFTEGMQDEKLEFLETTDDYVVKLFSSYFYNDMKHKT